MQTVSVLPPSGGATITIAGRTYTGADGALVSMPDADAQRAAANGWTIVPYAGGSITEAAVLTALGYTPANQPKATQVLVVYNNAGTQAFTNNSGFAKVTIFDSVYKAGGDAISWNAVTNTGTILKNGIYTTHVNTDFDPLASGFVTISLAGSNNSAQDNEGYGGVCIDLGWTPFTPFASGSGLFNLPIAVFPALVGDTFYVNCRAATTPGGVNAVMNYMQFGVRRIGDLAE